MILDSFAEGANVNEVQCFHWFGASLETSFLRIRAKATVETKIPLRFISVSDIIWLEGATADVS